MMTCAMLQFDTLWWEEFDGEYNSSGVHLE